nr:hypothetical protein [Tanacetum cinerariifolium]
MSLVLKAYDTALDDGVVLVKRLFNKMKLVIQLESFQRNDKWIVRITFLQVRYMKSAAAGHQPAAAGHHHHRKTFLVTGNRRRPPPPSPEK